MPEMADAGKHHREAKSIRRGDHLTITDGATGLNHRGDSGFGRFLDTIGLMRNGVRA